jgi:hypothetical protein
MNQECTVGEGNKRAITIGDYNVNARFGPHPNPKTMCTNRCPPDHSPMSNVGVKNERSLQFLVFSTDPYAQNVKIACCLWRSECGVRIFDREVPQLRRLVASFPSRRPWFEPRTGQVGFVVDKMTLAQSLQEYFSFPATQQIVAEVQSRLSLTLPQET